MKKKDWIVLGLIFAVLFVVFFDLFTLQQAFLSGDHREQQYPWAKFYQEQIRQFSLPWWTTHLGCGFPLLAEGQIGAFYPLNYLFFFALPVKVAYNYGILFHYLLGGFLFYIFLRHLKLSRWASFFSTLIYLLGSTQGGYFYYNYISQKVVIWLPLTLLLADLLQEKRRVRDAFFLGIVFAVQIFGGYLQVAIYSIFYTLCYLAYAWVCKRNGRFFWLCLLAGGLGILFSMAQLLPTYELALLSSRANAAKDIAYLGSMNPLGLMTLFYPSWDGFFRSELYLGLAGLFCFFFSFLHPFRPHKRFFLLAFFLFLLLALGRFSPLYVALVEGTGFTSFRTPIKFLFFVSFSGAVLAAYGFDYLFSNLRAVPQKLHRLSGLFAGVMAFMIAVPLWGPCLLSSLRPFLLEKLQSYVKGHIFAQPGHPYSLEAYLEKAASFYDGAVRAISLADHQTLTQWFLLITMFLLVFWLFRSPRSLRIRKIALTFFLFMDLFFYGFTSIQPNREPFNSIDNLKRNSPLVGPLFAETHPFRIMEVYDQPEQNREYPLFPCGNMLLGIDDIGIYSPLAIKAYTNYLAEWGYVNDSLAVSWVDPQSVLEHMPDLSFLNVKYLYSIRGLNHPALKEMRREENVRLYENRNYLSRAFFIPGGRSLESLKELAGREVLPVSITHYGQQSILLEMEAPRDGLLVVSDLAYPGWVARVDEREVLIRKAAGLFRSLPIEKGRHEVTFLYEPVIFKRWAAVGAVVFLTGFLILFFQWVRRRFRGAQKKS